MPDKNSTDNIDDEADEDNDDEFVLLRQFSLHGTVGTALPISIWNVSPEITVYGKNLDFWE